MKIGENFNSSWSYKFKKLLDSGGSADVLLYTRHTEGLPKQDVVLKVIRASTRATSELLNEGKRLSELKHPHILTTFGYEKIGPAKFALVLEYVKGKNLREILPKLKSQDRNEVALYVIRTVLGALHAAHSQKIIHGDISSRNILISEAGALKLSDFGESRTLECVTSHIPQKGSIDYLSPERWEGSPTSMESDIFAVGILAYELLSGENPLREITKKTVAAKISSFVAENPWRIYKGWSEFFEKSLALDPVLREAPQVLLGMLVRDAFGAEKLKDYLKGLSAPAKLGVLGTSTLTFSKKVVYLWAFNLLRPLIIMVLLINSVAIGVDHSLNAKRMKPSSLTLTSSPWGEVFIDGVSFGYTPLLNIYFRSGAHRLVWKDAAGATVEKTLMDYGNGLFAYQILKGRGGLITVAPLMNGAPKVALEP